MLTIGKCPGTKDMQKHSDCVDIGLHRGCRPSKQFRRNVVWGAGKPAATVEIVAEPEVHQQNAASLVAHGIACLDIAVQQSCMMHGGQRFAYSDSNLGCLFAADRTLRSKDVGECLAAHKIAPKANSAVLAIDPINGNNVFMPHACNRSRL